MSFAAKVSALPEHHVGCLTQVWLPYQPYTCHENHASLSSVLLAQPVVISCLSVQKSLQSFCLCVALHSTVAWVLSRSGRTGRAGKTGVCVTLVGRNKEGLIPFIEKKAGVKFERTGAPQPADMAKVAGTQRLRT